jgi:multisubunit Na+/H+ antiporter MnhB subunit
MSLPTNWDLRTAVVLALLALLPVAVFLLLKNTPIVALSLVSVVIIGVALFLMFSPSEADVRPSRG